MYLNDIIKADREIVHYLKEATASLNEYVEVSLYDSLFEAATNDTIVEVEANNEKSIQKSKNFLQKVFDGIIQVFRNIKNAVVNFIDKQKMSSKEREEFDEFNRLLKENPQLGNKKITVKDYRKIQAQYDEYIKMCDEAIREAAKGKKTDAKQLVDKISTFLKNTGTDATAVVTVNVLRKMAAQNKVIAKDIQTALKYDQGFITNLWDKTLGEKESTKVQKQLKNCTHTFSFTRLKNRLLLGKVENIGEMLRDLFKTKRGLLDMCKTAKKTDNLGQVVDVAKDIAAFSVRDAAAQKASETAKDVANKVKKGIDVVNPFNKKRRAEKAKRVRSDFYSFKKKDKDDD